MNARLRSWIDYFLFALVGLTSWLLVNGMFTQLPAFFQLPGGTKIPSYISLAIQTSNVFPLVFVSVASHMRFRDDRFPMLAVAVLAILSGLFLALMWSVVSEGLPVGVVVGGFLAGAVGSTSVVLFFPFASLFGVNYTSAISTGMGLTSLVAALVSILQQPSSSQPAFSTTIYFFILSALLVCGLFALIWIITRHPVALAHRDAASVRELVTAVHSRTTVDLSTDQEAPSDFEQPDPDIQHHFRHNQNQDPTLIQDQSTRSNNQPPQSASNTNQQPTADLLYQLEEESNQSESDLLMVERSSSGMGGHDYSLADVFSTAYIPLLNQVWINTLYYFLKGLVNYSVAHYPHADSMVFWLNALAMLFDSLGRFSTGLVRIYMINTMSIIHTALWTFLTIASCMTKDPLAFPWGGYLIIAVNSIYVFLYTYEDTVIYQSIPERLVNSNPRFVHQICRITGICNQLGSFTGALLSFFLVQFAPIFSSP
ncbi:MAG: hypothetical protein Q8P67_18525 [archaeon]|nr:hypothetical protein [archaeon]